MGSFSLSNQKSTIRPDNKTTNPAGNHHLFGFIGFPGLETRNFGSDQVLIFWVFLHTLVGAFVARETNSECHHRLIGGYQGFPALDSGKLGNFGLGRVSDFPGFLKTLVGVLAARENTRENENKQS